jgi:hypothetical protein
MVAGTVEVRDERANDEELLHVQCGHFAHSFPGDCLVVQAIATPGGLGLFLLPTVNPAEAAMIVVAEPTEVVDRGHFEVGARERREAAHEKQIPSWRGEAPVRPRRQGRRGVAFIGAQRKPLHGRSGWIRRRV